MPTHLKIAGMDQALRNLRSIANEYPHETAAALYREGESIMYDSKKEIPVDTGAARDSGFVEEPKIEGSKVSVTLGYGGVAAKVNPKTGEPTGAYIEILHENMDAKHVVGKAKFLEDPAKAHKIDFIQRITKSVRKIAEKRRAL